VAVYVLPLTFTFPIVLSAFLVVTYQIESAFGRESAGKL